MRAPWGEFLWQSLLWTTENSLRLLGRAMPAGKYRKLSMP
jgi:hypothetical protein